MDISTSILKTTTKFFLLSSCFSLIYSCKKVETKNNDASTSISEINFSCGDEVKIGHEFPFAIKVKGTKPDSMFLTLDGEVIAPVVDTSTKIVLNHAVGKFAVKIKYFHEGKANYSKSRELFVAAPNEPIHRKVVIKKEYPHSRSHYTQGLEYDSETDNLLESTGLRGESILHVISIDGSKEKMSHKLVNSYFGEGCTIIGDNIYQITWTSRTGFIYDKHSLEHYRSFEFPAGIREGWGLTHNDNFLIMSDGTSKIHFLDPESLTLHHSIQVFDHEKEIIYINELEYVNGLIYANVYQSDDIVVIDAKTGAVLEKIDCKGLLKPEKYEKDTDVLNGIAYDDKRNVFYITGKKWPTLFEVTFE